jgi:hypothetical protein
MKALILESINAWKNYQKRMPSRSSASVIRSHSLPGAEAMLTPNSRDLRMWFSITSSRMTQISLQKPEGDGQVASGSESLPGPVALETEEHKLEREQNERDVLEALW